MTTATSTQSATSTPASENTLRVSARLFAACALFKATKDIRYYLTGDLCSPAKWAIGEPWHSFEDRIESAVRTALGTHVSANLYATQIKRADLIALATEKRDLMPCVPGWAIGCAHIKPRDRVIKPWPPEKARLAFLTRYRELTTQEVEA